MHRNSLLLFEKYCLPMIKPGAAVLEVGPGGYPSQYLDAITRKAGSIFYFCCDRNNGRLAKRVRGAPVNQVDMLTEWRIDCEPETYDVVLSGQVLGYCQRPWVLVPEMARVLRPGGILMTITPLTWKYGPCPFDGWRMYASALRVLYEDAGLEILLTKTESLDQSSDDHRFQTNPGPVIDTLAIGRKPLNTQKSDGV